MKWLSRFALIAAVAMLAACKDSSDDGLVTISGPPGALKILAKGGAGADGTGGDAGTIDIQAVSGKGIQVLKSGSVNVDFVIPAVTIFQGWNPRIIAAGQTVSIALEGSGVVANETYLPVDGTFGIRGGVDSNAPATSLTIQAGGKLVLHPNSIVHNAAGYLDTARVDFANGVQVEGALTMGPWVLNIIPKSRMEAGTSVDNTSWLDLQADNLVVNGTIDLSGLADSADVDLIGGTGGGLDASIDGTVVIGGAGRILSIGGAGPIGGNGGPVSINSDTYGIFSAGTITTSGGAGSAGGGGSAGDILFSTPSEGGIYNAGPLTAIGGDGAATTDGCGGAGGSISLYAGVFLLSNATLNSSGGSATVAAEATGGGNAGGNAKNIVLAVNGTFRVAGALIARGGNGKGAYNSKSDGGSGGDISVGSNDDIEGPPLLTAEGAVGAEIDSSGGSGASGGSAGDVEIELISETAPLLVVGYERLDASGGDGTRGGGSAGEIDLYSNALYLPGYANAIGGNLVNEVPLVARGGNGSGSDAGWIVKGGYGGKVYLNAGVEIEGEGMQEGLDSNSSLSNSGAIDIRPGEGTSGSNGYEGNTVEFDSSGNITNTGAINAAGVQNASGSPVYFYADDTLTSSADITADGGASNDSYPAGSGNCIHLFASNASVSGTLSSRGGAAKRNIAGGGGHVWMMIANTLSCTAAILVDGGDSLGDGTGYGYVNSIGGHGGPIDLFGLKVSTSGPLSSTGGDAGTGVWVIGSHGGDGGNIMVTSILAPSLVTSPKSVAPGTGVEPGERGNIWIDGVLIISGSGGGP